jgi:RimJ/RimL family protein N-acetyltransferase
MKVDRVPNSLSRNAHSADLYVDRFRLRSEGVLTQPEIDWCRETGIPLGYDPIQIGWVTLDCEDDISWSSVPQAKLTPTHPGFNPKIVTGEYCFRIWGIDDAPDLARMLSLEELWRYLPEDFGGELDVASAEQLIRLSNDSDHHLVRAVEHAGDVIGQVRLDFRGAEDTAAEISYWLDVPYWGKGHGSAMVATFSEASFHARPRLDRLIARVHRDNLASARILKKIGFEPSANGAPESLWTHFEVLRSTIARNKA